MAQLIHSPISYAAIPMGMNEIIPNLWLGDLLSTYNVDKLNDKNVTLVISLNDRSLPQWLRTQYQERGIRHQDFRVHDDDLEDILKILPAVCDSIDAKLSKNQAVLVHCALGISRSGSAVVAYLMRSQTIDRDEALSTVRRSRPRVQPNSGFWEQLEIWHMCQYEVWEVVKGVQKENELYSSWKHKAEERMKERVCEI